MELLAILDVEATCEFSAGRFTSTWVNEVIELPVVLLDTKTHSIVAEFRRFVRPIEQPVLTAFCTSLTGITQDHVDAAQPLDVVLTELDAWLVEQGLLSAGADGGAHCAAGSGGPGSRTAARKWAFACDGTWDFDKFLGQECVRKGIPLRPHLCTWVNIRSAFATHNSKRQRNVKAMLSHYGLAFKGHEHSGIDDSRNIARIAVEMLREGWRPVLNEALTYTSKTRQDALADRLLAAVAAGGAKAPMVADADVGFVFEEPDDADPRK